MIAVSEVELTVAAFLIVLDIVVIAAAIFETFPRSVIVAPVEPCESIAEASSDAVEMLLPSVTRTVSFAPIRSCVVL
jgi:hypothetical protein